MSSRFSKRLRALWLRRQLDRDLDDELRFHLEMKASELGDPEAARRRVGNPTALKEACRELWSFARLESWWQDLRYALRMLAKTPGLSLVAVLALALGIGADTAIFTIANGAFIWNLGLEHLDRTVFINLTDPARRDGFGISYPDFRDFRSQAKSLAGLAAYRIASANLSDPKRFPERYWAAQMSANGFGVSEQKALLGRVFEDRDELPGAVPVTVLAYHVWHDRYGGDPAIVGRTIRVNDVPTAIVGVMPPGKRFPEDVDLWTPLIPDEQLERRENRSVALFGLVREGNKLALVRNEMSAIAGRLAIQYPATNKRLTADVEPIAQITGAYAMRPLFVALWVAVGFVLLIACADVANMLLARGAGRMREISIRVAIGAGRSRIVRQLLIESLTLSVAGGFLGWFVALGGLRWFDAGTGGLPKPVWLNLTLDRTAFEYLAAVSVCAGILFGLAPALRLARTDVHTSMKDGGQGVAGGRGLGSLANLLVVLETALCIILLAGAGLMIRSTVNLYAAPIGVNTANVLSMRLSLPEAKYPSGAELNAFHRTLKSRLESLAGVDSSGVASNMPFGRWISYSWEFEGKPSEAEDRAPTIGAIVASPGYFRVMQVRPRRGRLFTEADTATAAPVALINETFAAKYWPGEDPVGKHLRTVQNHTQQPWITVAGVIPDILQDFQRPLEHVALAYLPFDQQPLREAFVVLRTHVPPGTLAEASRRVVQEMDGNLPLYDVRSLEDRMAQNRLSVTLIGGMFSVFAAVALLLASIGLYAVVAHSISQRTQEIGVRMAVGGARLDILKLVYAQGMRPLAIGMAIGLPAAFGVTHVLRMVLVGVAPGDPVTFLLVTLVLVVAGVLGCAIPARRATQVDPIVALRYE